MILTINYLSIEFSLKSQLQVVEGECSTGYFIAGSHRALASREESGVRTGGPEPSQHGDCLEVILQIPGAKWSPVLSLLPPASLSSHPPPD